ncbi:MAG: hypothetical protein HY549_06190 [Elusimicrobia bacterium]|nr:hypothetical protein [Elusimicrobiota bacterium]
MRFEVKEDKLLIDCAFDGAAERCRLDTGLDRTALSYRTSTRYKRRGGGRKTETVRVRAFKLGDHPVRRVRMVGWPRGGHALVGMDALIGRRVSFDFDRNVLEINVPAQQWAGRLLIFSGGQFAVGATIGGGAVHALWNTGSEVCVVDEEYVRQHAADFIFINRERLGEVEMELYRARTLKIGGVPIGETEMFVDPGFSKIRAAYGPDVHMILGLNVIEQLNWYFDLGGGFWSSTPRHGGGDEG